MKRRVLLRGLGAAPVYGVAVPWVDFQRELIHQGLGNDASDLFGPLPADAMIQVALDPDPTNTSPLAYRYTSASGGGGNGTGGVHGFAQSMGISDASYLGRIANAYNDAIAKASSTGTLVQSLFSPLVKPIISPNGTITYTGMDYVMWGLSAVSSGVSAYHGYKRNNSVGWAIWWGLMGGMFPIITPVIAVAEGYGRPRR